MNATDRVMRWHLIIEEYDPMFNYIQGHKNIVADVLSRLHLLPDPVNSVSAPSESYLAETFGLKKSDLPITIYPLYFKLKILNV